MVLLKVGSSKSPGYMCYQLENMRMGNSYHRQASCNKWTGLTLSWILAYRHLMGFWLRSLMGT